MLCRLILTHTGVKASLSVTGLMEDRYPQSRQHQLMVTVEGSLRFYMLKVVAGDELLHL